MWARSVIVGHYQQHIYDGGVANPGAQGLKAGVGDPVLPQQFQDELHHCGVSIGQARRGAVFVNGGDKVVVQPGLFGGALVDRPNVMAAGFPGRGQYGQGLDAGVQGRLETGVTAEGRKVAGGFGVVEDGSVIAGNPAAAAFDFVPGGLPVPGRWYRGS